MSNAIWEMVRLKVIEQKKNNEQTMAVHVRYNSWHISLPFSARRQRKMTKFYVVWKTYTTKANF